MGIEAEKIDFGAWDKEIAQKEPQKSKVLDFGEWDKEIEAQEKTEKRGLMGDVISGVTRGVAVEMPKLFLDTAAATERITRKVFGAEKETGLIGEFAKAGKEGLEEFRSTHPILRAKEKPGIISQGVEAAAMSLSSGAPGAAAGFAIGSMFGPASPITAPLGALIGFATSGGLTFGLAEYENVIQLSDEQGISREESEPAAIISGLAEGGFEFASDLITGGLLKVAKPLTIPAKEMLKTGIRQTFKMGMKEVLARSAAVMASETSMEMLTAGVQAEQYKKIGLGDSTFWEGAKEAMGPAFVASVIFAGVGTGATRLHKNSIRRNLENAEINPEKRMQAAEEVGQVLDKVDKDLAATWRTNAFEAISSKESIDIDDPDLIRQTAFTRASQEPEGPTPENIAEKEKEVQQEIQTEKQDDIKKYVISGIATGDITEKDARKVGQSVGLEPQEINQSIIQGMDVQRMFEEADPIELKPFAVHNDIAIPASITDGKQIVTIIQEGLKEEGSIIAELAKQVKNLEKTSITPGMEHTAENLKKKKEALDKVLPAAEEEPPVIHGEEDLEILPEDLEKKVEELAEEPESEAESDREEGGRLAPIQPEEGLKGEEAAPGRPVSEPEPGREEGTPGPVLEKEEVTEPEIKPEEPIKPPEKPEIVPEPKIMTREEFDQQTHAKIGWTDEIRAREYNAYLDSFKKEAKPIPEPTKPEKVEEAKAGEVVKATEAEIAEYKKLKDGFMSYKFKTDAPEFKRLSELEYIVEGKEKPTPTPEVKGKEAWEIPKTVQRIEEKGIETSLDKPQGLYTSPADIKSPHKDLKGKKTVYETNPNAKVLTVDASELIETNRGRVGKSAGIATLENLVELKEFNRLLKTSKKELIEELNNKYPEIKWDKYYDSQEILEGYAGQLAREQGYDAIYAPDKVAPEFTEYVALTKNAFLKKPPPSPEKTGVALEGEKGKEEIKVGTEIPNKGKVTWISKDKAEIEYREPKHKVIVRAKYSDVIRWLKEKEEIKITGKEDKVKPKMAEVEEEKSQYQVGKSIPAVGGESIIELVRKLPFLAKQNTGLSPDGSIWIRNKNGKGFNIKAVNRIAEDRIALEIGHGRMLEDGEFIKGKYQDGKIELQKDMADEWVLAHETEHFLEDYGFINKTDQSILSNHIKGLVKKGKWDSEGRPAGGQEDRAVYIAQFLRDRSIKGPIGRILTKIADFVDALVNVFKRTARGIGREIESGKVFEGKPEVSEKGMPLFQKGKPKPINAFPEHVQPEIEAARGLEKESFLARVKEGAKDVLKSITPGMAFPNLPAKKYGAVLDSLRIFKEVPINARRKALRDIKGIIGELNPDEYETFMYRILVGDMLSDIDKEEGPLADWEFEGLPFEFKNRDEVEQTLNNLKKMVDANPKIRDALKKRQTYLRDMRRELVKNGFLPKSVLKNDEYWHHQVLDYMNLKQATGTATQDVRTHKKGYQIHRTGSRRLYNTEYVESEFEVLAHGIAHLEAKKVIDEIDRDQNIIKSLRQAAKSENEQRIYAAVRKQWGLGPNDEIPNDLDPLFPYRQKIAMGMSNLAKMAKKGELWGPPEFERLIEDLSETQDTDDPKFFQFLSYLIQNDQPGANWAATIFKGIRDRNSFIKDALGKRLQTWQSIMKRDYPGYVEWRPKPGTAWYTTNSIADNILDQVLTGAKPLTEADVKKVLARGMDVKWVIPKELADTLDNFRVLKNEGPIPKAAESMMNWWKRYILINPVRVLKYNTNNLSGDADICLAYDYKIIWDYGRQAAKDLWKWHYNKGMSDALKSEFEEAEKHGVIGGGMTVHDIPDITSKITEDKTIQAIMGNKPDMIGKGRQAWEGLKNFTTWRENVLRIAAYRYFKDRIQRGDKNVYGASDRNKVNAVKDPKRKAALLSRELVGDYGNLSEGGQWLRRKAIPFYCVPDDTEILTKDGWQKYDEIDKGTIALTYNVEKHITEWEPISDIAAFDFDDELVTLQNKLGSKFRFTEDHRFPIIEQYGNKRKIVRVCDFKTHYKIPLVAPHKNRNESILTAKEAALLGWIVTDGYHRWRGKHLETMIYQSQKKFADKIRFMFKGWINSDKPHPDTGVVCFRIKVSALNNIKKCFQSKDDLPSIVTRLDEKALKAMFEAMMDAEGTWNDRKGHQFGQMKGPVLEAFQIICYLLGKSYQINGYKNGCHGGYIRKRDKISLFKWELGKKKYKGKVWCPVTPNSTWIMRQGGHAIITGNSWMEINAPRYVRMARNLPHEGEKTNRVYAMAGLSLAKKGAAFTTKAMLMYGAVMLYNHLVWPEEEEELGDYGRHQMHVILGKREDGSIITLRFQGALSDALLWFGAEDFPQDISDLATRKKSFYDWLKEDVGSGFVNRLYQSIRPDVKMLGESVSGVATYPDVFRPRPIRDLGEHLSRTVSMDILYRYLVGKPHRAGDDISDQIMHDLSSLITYTADPGEMAYYTARKWASEFMEEKGIERPYVEPTDKSNALYYYKQALKYGDYKAAEKYLQKYKDLGGNMKGMRISISRGHPLIGIKTRYRKEFKDSLNPKDRATLERAIGWYKKTY